jgi:hypothetical protein
MIDELMKLWESLFVRALAILDQACRAGMPCDWSFGGGTVPDVATESSRLESDLIAFYRQMLRIQFITRP